ncbi:MAG: hypothetical protein KDD36_05940 [Flavobacteriales bacterium]|nr:hypothetical protein [Flavobacteriales bacterium]
MNSGQTSEIKIRSGTVSLLPNGIILAQTGDNLILEMGDVREFTEAMATIAGDQKLPVLTIPGINTTAGPDVREYSSSEEGCRNVLARAIITGSFAQELLANFFIRFNKPVVPTRLFHNRAQAEKWLLELLAVKKKGVMEYEQ